MEPLFDRFVHKAGGLVRYGRTATRRHAIDDYNFDEDPFEEEPQHARWLLTTCIAAAAGTVLVGGTLVGLFNNHSGTSTALASLQSSALWPALVPGKTSLAAVPDAAPAGEPIADQFVHQASAPTGVSTDGLSYHSPTVIEGAYRMAALARSSPTRRRPT
jgi:hypothetical protein